MPMIAPWHVGWAKPRTCAACPRQPLYSLRRRSWARARYVGAQSTEPSGALCPPCAGPPLRSVSSDVTEMPGAIEQARLVRRILVQHGDAGIVEALRNDDACGQARMALDQSTADQ